MVKNSSEDNFLVFNSDTIWSLDYLTCIMEMENFYYTNKIKNVLLIVNKKQSFDKSLKGDFNLNNNKLTRNSVNNYIFTGCQIINKSIIKSINKKTFSILEIWDQLISQQDLFGIESKNTFYHVTNLEIYNKLSKN